jgi:hypothetical protein
MSTFREIAMESDEENAVVISDAELDDTIDGFEEEDAGAELSEIEGAIDVTSSAIDGMEALHDAVEECQKNGGLDSQAAALLNVAVESVMRPFGGTTSKSMPALESYEGDGGRATATGFALESIADTLKNMWEAIVGMMVKAAAAVKAWFIEKFNKFKRIESAANALAKKAGDSKATAKKEDSIPAGAAGIFGGDLKMNVIKGISGDVKSTIDGFSKSSTNAVTVAMKADISDTGSINTFVAAHKEAVKKRNGEFNSGSWIHAPSSAPIKASSGSVLFVHKNSVMSSSAELYASIPDNEEGTGAIVVTLAPNKNTKSKDKIKALSKEEVISYSKAVADEAKSLYTMSGVIMHIFEKNNKAKAAGEKLVNASRKADNVNAETRVALKSTLSMMHNLVSVERNVAVKMTAQGGTVLSAVLSFANSSLKNLKEA